MSALRNVAAIAFVGLAGLLPPSLHPQATSYPEKPPLLVGAAWYPEQWPESQWDKDLAQMEAAHINLVRIAEFAWSTMEPSEGRYDFDWLERAISVAAKHHICVVLGTPTAAPPAWLTTKYPDTLRWDDQGHRDEHGNRAQASFTSPRYRLFAHQIAEQMALRFGHNPNVVGWQIDNEISETSLDESAKDQFHTWLKKKYGTIQSLNQHWATAYWSQTYDDFAQIPAHEKDQNPALLLEWRRFVTDTWKSYMENQVSAIRPHADPRQFITTNTMSWFDGFDEYAVHSVLDVAAWDDYVGGDGYNFVDNGAGHDLTRGYKQKNFWVMETEPGFVNWRETNTSLHKGQVRDMAWQAIGHGADAVEYWQWRSAPNGQEQYHGVLVGADGAPVPVYDEVQQLAAEVAKAAPELSGTSPTSEVALVNDYDSRWAITFQRHSAGFDPVGEMLAFYRPIREQSQAVDIISVHAELDNYKVVVIPSLNVIDQDTADRLMTYVRNGGHLLLGPRTGMKDEYNALQPKRQPGSLAEFVGARVEQFYGIETKIPLIGPLGQGTANIWAEQLSVQSPETEILLRYGTDALRSGAAPGEKAGLNGWLDNEPAVTTRKVGRGSVMYVGAWLDEALMKRLTQQLLETAGVAPVLPNVPQNIEVCKRTGNGKSVFIIINYNRSEQHIALPGKMRDLLGEQNSIKSIDLPPYGVAVLSAPQ